MHIPDTLLATLRPYIVTRLSTVSEADNDVLADYVLELLKSDGDEAAVKRNAKEQLAEFLPGEGDDFVDDVFAQIPGSASAGGHAAAGRYGAGAEHDAGGDAGNAFGQGGYARKRGRDDGDETMLDSEEAPARGGGWGDRPVKSARYGGGRGRGRGGYNGMAAPFVPQQQQQQQQQQQFGMPGMTFDPADPMASLMAMQQAFLSGQGMLDPLQQGQGLAQRPRTGKRCRDYDNKGVCTRGANCPYDHGDDFEEYDPGNRRPNGRGRGGDRGRGDRGRGGRGGRADFSHAGPVHGARVKSLVVENIPEEHFTEESIKGFFSEFGDLEDVTLDAEGRRLAVLKFTDSDAAKRAHDSPKVVFDNRFVKVYWYKPEVMAQSNGTGHRGAKPGEDTEMETEQPAIDPEAFARQQAAAQEKFESLKAAKAQREELEAKMRAQAAEREKLMQMLAAKTKSKAVAANGTTTTASPAPPAAKSSQTETLRAQLAALEAEARSIGINPQAPDFAPRGRGRGRAGFVPRGRGGYRGGWRGGAAGAFGGAVKRLDNRPRCVSVAFGGKERDEETDEGLKQFLLFTNQIQAAKITAHPSRADAALVAFTERYRAEAFLAAVAAKGSELPHVGRVEVAWVPNADVPDDAFPEEAGVDGGDDGAASVSGTWGELGTGEVQGAAADAGGAEPVAVEMDYDVADDDARWLVG